MLQPDSPPRREATPPQPAMTAAEQANFKALMKQTEELVTKARLDQIARDHKSMGAILDDRILYKIEEPKKRNKRQSFKTALQLQREAELQELQAADDAEQMIKIANAAMQLKKQNDYSTERQIWKEKSGPAIYSQARRFQFPGLQKFKESMTHEQQIQFKRRTNAALIVLADKFREECKELKSDMDLNGVFHPEANAHRVHCIYLMKLYKGIRSDTIEDPILRQMQAEEEQRIADLKALEIQKQELLRSMEAADFANMTPAQQEIALAEAEAKKRDEEERQREQKASDEASVEKGRDNDSNNQGTAGSVGSNSNSVSLSVSISGAKGQSEKGNSPTPTNKANVHFAKVGSSKTLKPSSDGDSDKVMKASSSSGKVAGASLKRNASSDKIEAETSNNTLANTGFGSASTKTPKAGAAANGAAGTSTAVAPKSALHKSASTPAVGSGSEKILSSGSTKQPSLSTSSSSSKLPPAADTFNADAPLGDANKANMRRSSNSKSAPALAGTGRRRLLSGISEDLGEHSSQASTDRMSSPERDKNPHLKANEKLFKRIKNNKLGGAESRTLLEEEASKLDTAESFSMKKTRDKNNILETEMTDWMLSSVQKAQIGKTSVGTAMLTSGGISQHIKLPASSIVTEFNDSIKRTHASPSKMLPFDQFHDMFSTYSKQHVDPNATVPGVLSPISPHIKAGDANTASGVKKPRRRRQTDGTIGFHHDGGSLTSSVEEENSNISNRSRGSLLVPIDVHSSANHSHVEPTNLVKTLAEQDANFEAYLKLAQHQQEAATNPDSTTKMRTKLNSSISAPRRIRKMNPLGQNAIQLVDSRGRASKDSKKGFGNIFQEAKIDPEDGSADKGEGDDLSVDSASGATGKTKRSTIRINTHVNIMGTDNIMGRLHKMDDDEYSQHSSTLDGTGGAGGNNNNNSPLKQGSVASAESLSRASSPGTGMRSTGKLDEKDKFKSSRQSSRSRRRLMGSDSSSNLLGSAKAGVLVEDDGDDEGVIAAPELEQGMQDKLMAAWDSLQMPAAQRFGFMRKYSTDEYSMEMGRAVDMWSETALLVLAVAELNKLLGKIKAGTCIMPLTKHTVLRTVRCKVPPLLASSSEFFIPPSLGYYDPKIVHQTVPLSAAALSAVQALIETFFVQMGQPIENKRGGYMVTDLSECQALVSQVIAEIAILLKKSLKTIHVELNDTVPYGQKGCKEWIFTLTGTGVKKNVSAGALATMTEEFEDL